MTAAPPSRRPPVLGVLATAANFPIVFVGIIIITTQASGDDEVALLNLWALWGFLQALLGQIGLVTAAIDRLSWTSPAVLIRAAGFGVLTFVVVAPFSTRLFPEHASWSIVVALAASAVFVIGRLRGTCSLLEDGVATVVVAAFENLIRTSLLLALVLADLLDWAALAIAAPFLSSIAVLHLRTRGRPIERSMDSGPAHLWSGVIAALPAVSAYAIVPGLTLLGRVDDLDAIAIATSLLRGPLLVASFASAWILQSVSSGRQMVNGIANVLPILLAGHLLIEALDAPFRTALFLHGTLSGLALMGSYLSALEDVPRLDRLAGWGAAVAVAAITTFSFLLVLSGSVGVLHPFVALTAVAILVAMAAQWRPARTGEST